MHKLLAIFVVLALFLLHALEMAEGQDFEYVVNSYGDSMIGGFFQVKTVFIDLDTKAIIREVTIADQGNIVNNKPVRIKQGADTLLASVVLIDCFCFNTSAGLNKTIFAVIDPRLRQMVYSRIDTNLFLHTFYQQPDYTVFASGDWMLETTPPRIDGIYELAEDYSLLKVRESPQDLSPHLFKGPEPCEVIKTLSPEMDLYHGKCEDGYFIIRTDPKRTEIVDRLSIPLNLITTDTLNEIAMNDRAHVFAIKDTFLFDFNLNYEVYAQHNWVKRHDQGRIEPHVKIFDARTFATVDSIPIPDYPEGEFINGEIGVADVVGPYLVFYFFDCQGIELYAPAMLFIFDTRTNEATWLRVGWR